MKAAPGTAFHASALVAIALLTAALYANTLDVPFVFDDEPNIVEHPATHADRIDFESLRRAARESRSRSRPVAYLGFAIQHAVHGLEVRGYHVVNTAIHALNGVLVYALGLLLLGRLATRKEQRFALREADVPWAALFAALLFVAHPVQTQAVTYVVQRMTSLATFFHLGALTLFLVGRNAERGLRRGSAWLGAALCFALALGTKQISAVLPFSLLLVEWMFYRDARVDWLRRRWLWIALGTGALVAFSIAFMGTSPIDRVLAGYAERDFTLGQRLLTQPRVLVFYLSLLLFPAPSRLSLLHYFEPSTSLLSPPQTLLCLLLLLILAALALRARSSLRILSFAIAWWFLHLAIESSVIALEMAYEHRVYLPSVGFFLCAGALLFGALPQRRRTALAVAAVCVAALSIATVARNETWRDPIAFWRDVVAKSPGDYRSHVNLGNELIAQGRIDEAGRHIEAGMAVAPDSPFARYAAGVAYERAGRLPEAERSFRDAVDRAPTFARAHAALGSALAGQGRPGDAAVAFETALRLAPDDLGPTPGLAAALAQLGRIDEAAALLDRVLRSDPQHTAALRERGALALLSGRAAEAERDLQAALALAPHDPTANFYLAGLREAQRRDAEAIALLERTLRARPGLDAAANNLAWLLATAREAKLRRPERAVELAQAASAAAAHDGGRLDTLAAAYAAAGRFDEAARSAERAAALARNAGADALAAQITERADLYRERRAYVSP